MRYKNLGIYDLIKSAEDKSLICFGAGRQLSNACELFSDVSFFDRIDLIADNNKSRHTFAFGGKEKPVASIEDCLKSSKKKPIMLITVAECMDIIMQLERIPELHDCDCYVYTFLRYHVQPYRLPANRAENEPLKIPKTIHYCWFGGNPIRDDFKGYIETWKKHCPDYEIVRWDESNYDYKKNEYMFEAFKHRKWGFVPDFARLDIIYSYGGVYLDTDVEIKRNIDDLLCDDAFCGFENRRQVNNGSGFGAVVGFPLILGQMQAYSSISFINNDGTLNLTPGPVYQTEYMRSKGLVYNNTLQQVQGMTVYPTDVMSPSGYAADELDITDNTYSVHHYATTWFDDAQQDKKNRLIKNNNFVAERFRVQN